MVRGFALFGVLLVNMYGFGADSIAWNFPTDKLAFVIMRVFFESKSWTLFSMLFGFGFAVQLQRAHERGFRILRRLLSDSSLSDKDQIALRRELQAEHAGFMTLFLKLKSA